MGNGPPSASLSSLTSPQENILYVMQEDNNLTEV